MIDYGAKGCRCWRSEDYNPWDDRTHHEWLPNASCPHHGLLADFTERRDTGVYTVIRGEPGPEAVGWPCDEGEDLRTGSAYTRAPDAHPHHWTYRATTTQKERGVLAAIRRWSRGGHRVFTGWRR